MKVYLLSIDNRRFFFYADASEAAREEEDLSEPSVPTSTGLWVWLLDRYHKFQSAWEHSDSRIARWTRRSWDWLHTWSHPDESMLVRLRSARRIDLHHPASRPAVEVRAPLGRLSESSMVAPSPLAKHQRSDRAVHDCVRDPARSECDRLLVPVSGDPPCVDRLGDSPGAGRPDPDRPASAAIARSTNRARRCRARPSTLHSMERPPSWTSMWPGPSPSLRS